jgi:CRISPR system Cascade subunit CasE
MTLYLSRLILDRRSRQVRRDVAQPYEMHRTLLRAFPQGTAGADDGAASRNGLLWRLDEDRRSGRLTVLVQSAERPDWSRLTCAFPDYCLDPAETEEGENPCGPKDIADRLQSISRGQTLAFRLRANPTRKQRREGGKDSARVGLVEEADQLAWIRRKAADGGFEALRISVRREDSPAHMAKGFKEEGGGRHKLSVLSVLYEGVLQVKDPELFRDTLVAGIGPGKAFGFGLLSLARCGGNGEGG